MVVTEWVIPLEPKLYNFDFLSTYGAKKELANVNVSGNKKKY